MFIYILKCADGSLYTGWTADLVRRVQTHEAGKASKYTRSRLPVRLIGWIGVSDRSHAKSIEAQFKRLTRAEKLRALEAGQAFGLTLHKA